MQVAYAILKGFDKSFRLYCNITAEAKQRFEKAQWQACQAASKKRIDLYEQSLTETVTGIYEGYLPQKQSLSFWKKVKSEFIFLLEGHKQFELAETFFNSVIGRVFKHQLIDDDVMFVRSSRCHLTAQAIPDFINTFEAQTSLKHTIENILAAYAFRIPFENYNRDLKNVMTEIKRKINVKTRLEITSVDLMKPTFYRGKAAYIIGRMRKSSGDIPFVIVFLVNDEGELYVDTLLTERRDLSVLFGFARAYFMVDTLHPAAIVDFLQELLPNKKNFEMYTAIGLYKHGKTVFYRNFLEHLHNSTDQFEIAPGTKGLVMQVFHQPSNGIVFKIIRDEFGESKKITRQDVIDRYKLVKNHDRIGRMADTHEFANFRLPLARVSDALMTELNESCANSIEVVGDELIIKHLYIERKMTPLNLYLAREDLTHGEIHHAIDDLGNCIKHIAMANIFPGDMLQKNFGITRHGRVIFYDYDEICYMSERNFRELPKSDDPYALDTLSVAPNDVFPEQFEHFIIGKRDLKALFKKLHGDLFKPEYWRNIQRQVARGEIYHAAPYPVQQRFKR
ncbi:bifunctional isocitrate dehydrogenase kinase/phosphatase [Alteromonas sp. a30]|nr:bifunctional isocitrate dehydrogenase kinase/phosphatase [Alteromonas sp. a30]